MFSHFRKWFRRETEVRSKWSRSRIEVKSKRRRSEIEVRPKWNRSETEVASKCHRSETEANSDCAPSLPQTSYPTLVGLIGIKTCIHTYSCLFHQIYDSVRWTQVLPNLMHANAAMPKHRGAKGQQSPKIMGGLFTEWQKIVQDRGTSSSKTVCMYRCICFYMF